MLGSYYALLVDILGDPDYFINLDGTEDPDKNKQSYAKTTKWFIVFTAFYRIPIPVTRDGLTNGSNACFPKPVPQSNQN